MLESHSHRVKRVNIVKVLKPLILPSTSLLQNKPKQKLMLSKNKLLDKEVSLKLILANIKYSDEK